MSGPGLGRSLIAATCLYDPAVSLAGLLRQMDQLRWVIAQNLSWGMKLSGRLIDLMVTKIKLLCETRFRNEYIIIKEIVKDRLIVNKD
jgi:hypothetical protein